MSNPDSFIDEVTEAVRRDQLFAMFRRYGWIAILAVVLIVGGAAWNEWSKRQVRLKAEAFGDSVLSALQSEDAPTRSAALAALTPTTPDQAALIALLQTGEEAGPAAVAALTAIRDNAEVPAIYRDLAEFKLVLGGADTLSAEDRAARLQALTAAGAPYRVLALEQLALIDVEAGRTAEAIERLTALETDTEATAGLRRRASQLIVALGGKPAGQ